MKIFFAVEVLANQFRPANRPIFGDNQTTIGFVVKKGLSDPEHDEGIDAAANHREQESRGDGAMEFAQKDFHSSNKFQRRNDQINELDSDKGNDDSTQAIDQQISPQHCQS